MAMEPMELMDFSLERVGALWGFALGVQGLACWYWFSFRARHIIREANLKCDIHVLTEKGVTLRNERDTARMDVARLTDKARKLSAPMYRGVPVWHQEPPMSPLRAVEKDQLAEAHKDRDAALEKLATQFDELHGMRGRLQHWQHKADGTEAELKRVNMHAGEQAARVIRMSEELAKVRKMVMSGEYRLSPSEVVWDFSDFLRKVWPHMSAGGLTQMAAHYSKAANHSMLREGWRKNCISVTLPPEIPRLIDRFEGWAKAYGPQGAETRPHPTDGEIGRTALEPDTRTPEHLADEKLQRELTCSNCGHFHYVAEDRTLRA